MSNWLMHRGKGTTAVVSMEVHEYNEMMRLANINYEIKRLSPKTQKILLRILSIRMKRGNDENM